MNKRDTLFNPGTSKSGDFILRCLHLLRFGAISCATACADPAFVWIEAESGRSSFPWTTGDWGRPDFLSGGSGLRIHIEDSTVEKEVPDDGILINHAVSVPHSGTYEVWNRVGFEFVRSPFEWLDAHRGGSGTDRGHGGKGGGGSSLIGRRWTTLADEPI